MSSARADRGPALIVLVGDRACALPLADVEETMRPQPIAAIAGAPTCVRGLAIIRGAPVPVIDLRALLEGVVAVAPTRLVTLRLGLRRVAVAVDHIVGVRSLDIDALAGLPPLLASAGASASVAAVATLDAELLVVLQTLRLLPDDAWAQLADATADATPRPEPEPGPEVAG